MLRVVKDAGRAAISLRHHIWRSETIRVPNESPIHYLNIALQRVYLRFDYQSLLTFLSDKYCDRRVHSPFVVPKRPLLLGATAHAPPRPLPHPFTPSRRCRTDAFLTVERSITKTLSAFMIRTTNKKLLENFYNK